MRKTDAVVIIAFLLVAIILPLSFSECKAESRVYWGPQWIHLSNVDAGVPFNHDSEDNGDHFGIAIEYQNHFKEGYFYSSFGIGKSNFNIVGRGSGWECSGCKLPSSLQVGVKWRLY